MDTLLVSRRVLAAGTISLTVLGTTYTQDFDTLANSATSDVLPQGWEFSEAGSNANTTYAAGTGSSNAGNTYSFGSSASPERAYGGLFSGSLNPTIGAAFTNNTGSTVTSLAISYTGEMWRAGVLNRNAADRLDFQLSTNATSLTTGTWVDYDSLDFNSPNTMTSAGELNGNASGNRATVNSTITALSILSGASFWIRWTDFDIAPGADDGLAVDDLSLTQSPRHGSVVATFPIDGATDFPVNASLSVTFNEPVGVGRS